MLGVEEAEEEEAEDEEEVEEAAGAAAEAEAGAAGEAGSAANEGEAPAAVGGKRKTTPTPGSGVSPARKAARKGAASTRGNRPDENPNRSSQRQRANAHVREYTLDGTVTARAEVQEALRLRPPLRLSWEQLLLPAPGDAEEHSMLEKAFEVGRCPNALA